MEKLVIDLDTNYEMSDARYYRISEERAKEISMILFLEASLLRPVADADTSRKTHKLLVAQSLANSLSRLNSINEVMYACFNSGKVVREAEIVCDPVEMMFILTQSIKFRKK